MGLFDKLRERFASATATSAPAPGPSRASAAPQGPRRNPDEAAVERYRYMLRTAQPETIEQAHAEAFAKLTPQQRQQVLADLGNEVPASERATSDDPRSLARMATRAEMRQPGAIERALGGGAPGRGGMGMGSMIAGTLLASVAGAFIGSAIADAFLDEDPGADELAGAETGDAGDPGAGDEFAAMDDFGGMDDFEI